MACVIYVNIHKKIVEWFNRSVKCTYSLETSSKEGCDRKNDFKKTELWIAYLCFYMYNYKIWFLERIDNMEGLIVLEDGTLFKGAGFGAEATNVGELVFNTSMVGYQEVLTDPSYAGQIINLTYPLIGNYGIARESNESDRIHAYGLIAKSISMTPSHYTSENRIDRWLYQMGIPGVSGVDTRAITRKIRNEGTVKCVISTQGISYQEAKDLCQKTALRQDQMKTVGTQELVHMAGNGHRVAVLDFGVKRNIVASLLTRGCDVYVFPYSSTAEEILAIKPEGIVLTNGPGDPGEATEAIAKTNRLMAKAPKIPMFGICMGHQIMALATGGETYKLKFGHRGGNHGVFDKDTGRSYITSQNHGYAVNADSMTKKGIEITHINLNDGTVEGMKHPNLPQFSVQFHPEACPGPRDSAYLIDRFVDMMKDGKK